MKLKIETVLGAGPLQFKIQILTVVVAHIKTGFTYNKIVVVGVAKEPFIKDVINQGGGVFAKRWFYVL